MSNTKKTIALCLCGTDEQYHSYFVVKIAETCRKYGYHLAYFTSFCNCYDGSEYNRGDLNIFNLVSFDQLAAMIIFPATFNGSPLCNQLISSAKQKDVPVVTVDGPTEGCYNIEFADEAGLADIITHFIDVHHFKRLNFIAGIKDNPGSEQRLNVYKRVLEEHGIPVEEKRIAYGEFWSRPAQEAVELYYWNYNEMPEAIICANDAMALGVIEKVEELGFRVPEDVCVSGFDGIPEAFTNNVKITTSKRYAQKVAVTAAKQCIQIIEGHVPNVGTTFVPNKNFYLESCGCNQLTYLMENNSTVSRQESFNANSYRSFSYHMIDMISRGMESRSFEKTLDIIQEKCERMWTKKCWVAISESFMQFCTGESSDFSYQSEAYPDMLRLVAKIENHVSVPVTDQSFSTKEILPEFESEMEQFGSILFAPIHFQNHTLGYIALEYHELLGSLSIFESFVFNVGILLEHFRVQAKLGLLTEN